MKIGSDPKLDKLDLKILHELQMDSTITYRALSERVALSPPCCSAKAVHTKARFVNNMFNKYGILNGPFSAQTAPAYLIVRPRTYGLRLDWSL